MLKDLVRWNYEREQYWLTMRRKVQYPEEFGNGFRCPVEVCDGELYDTGQMLPQSPPQLRVKCQKCNFRGFRYE